MYNPPIHKDLHHIASQLAAEADELAQKAQAAEEYAIRLQHDAARAAHIRNFQMKQAAARKTSGKRERSSRKDKRKFFPKRKSSCKKRKMVWKSATKRCNLRK